MNGLVRYIRVKVHPDVRRTRVLRLADDRFEVWLSEPAQDNRANAQLLRLMRRELSSDRVCIHSGHRGLLKILRVEMTGAN
jgi:uncharacterized protein YggU (UPF0235/DUF167 family)